MQDYEHKMQQLAEEYQQRILLADALSREASARESLEEEVVRLRQQTLEYKAQLDKHKSSVTTSSLPRVASSSQVLRRDPSSSHHIGPAVVTNVAAVAALQNSAARRNSMRAGNVGGAAASASNEAGVGGARSVASAVFAPAGDVPQQQHWENKWDGDADDDDDSDISSSTHGGVTPAGGSGSGKVSGGAAGSKNLAAGAQPGTAAAAVAHVSAPYRSEAVAVQNTYEKNLDAFRTKMKQVCLCFCCVSVQPGL
jgi:hypothetical protein